MKSSSQNRDRRQSSKVAVLNSQLSASCKHENAALGLPPIAEGETEFGRRRISVVNLGQRLLVKLSEFFTVRNKAPVEFERPVFSKRTQRNAGIVLDNEGTVFEQKIADAGETFAVHEIRCSFNQTNSWPTRCAPTKKTAVAAGKVSLEVIQRLRATAVTESDFHPFPRTVDIG